MRINGVLVATGEMLGDAGIDPANQLVIGRVHGTPMYRSPYDGLVRGFQREANPKFDSWGFYRTEGKE